MSQQSPTLYDTVSAPPAPPVKLWSSGVIAIMTFFLGFPGGLVLASTNWMRMGLKNKAIFHLIGGVVVVAIICVLSLLSPGAVAGGFSLIFNLAIVFYLQSQTRKDIDSFRSNNHEIQNANGFMAFLISLGMLLVYLVIAVVFLLFIEILLRIFGIQVTY